MRHKQVVIDVLEAEIKRLAFDANVYNSVGIHTPVGKSNHEKRVKLVEAIQDIKADELQLKMEIP